MVKKKIYSYIENSFLVFSVLFLSLSVNAQKNKIIPSKEKLESVIEQNIFGKVVIENDQMNLIVNIGDESQFRKRAQPIKIIIFTEPATGFTNGGNIVSRIILEPGMKNFEEIRLPKEAALIEIYPNGKINPIKGFGKNKKWKLNDGDHSRFVAKTRKLFYSALT